MNRYFLILLCAIIPVLASAQQDKSKYLAGAVPEVDGRVVFSKSITTKTAVSDADLYDIMLKWAEDNYGNKEEADLVSRVLLTNSEARDIACYGEEFFVYRKNAFILDRAKMMYQIIMDINSGKCDVTIRNIKYDYPPDEKAVPAEEMISDKVALNGKKDGLNRYYDKFRTRTVDSVNAIFNSIDVYLNGKPTIAAVSTPGAVASISTAKTETPDATGTATLSGYKLIATDKIPEKLLNDWTLITSGKSNQPDVMTALWGGTGAFSGKPIAYSTLNPKTFSVETVDKGDTYTISFFTEIYNDAIKDFSSASGKTADKIKKSGLTPIKTPSGALAFSEAWMIVECKKGGVQPGSTGGVENTSSGELSKDGYNKTYMGEILNVWVK